MREEDFGFFISAVEGGSCSVGDAEFEDVGPTEDEDDESSRNESPRDEFLRASCKQSCTISPAKRGGVTLRCRSTCGTGTMLL